MSNLKKNETELPTTEFDENELENQARALVRA